MNEATLITAEAAKDPAFGFGQPVSELYRDPAGYDPGADLRSAVDVSLLLGLPLLLTGEPGCGKTSVAHWLAWRLDLRRSVGLQRQVFQPRPGSALRIRRTRTVSRQQRWRKTEFAQLSPSQCPGPRHPILGRSATN